MLLAYLFYVCLIIFPASGQKQCSDCVRAVSCDLARQYLHKGEAERLRLQQEFCGFSDSGAPMVCCSSLGQDAVATTSRPHPRQSLLPNECGFIDGNRIIGGEEAKLYQFPWMALISYQTRDGPQFQCGGTLISERYVLTAAHCVKNRRLMGVRVGEHDLRTDVDCQGHGKKFTCEGNKQDKLIAKSIVHKDYDGIAKHGYDIALLRLTHPVNFNFKNAKPICLPEPQQQQRSISGENATVAGWGYTDYGFYSSVLLSVKLPILSEEQCRTERNLSPSDELRVICAGATGKDSCYGDSGGPLMLEGLHQGVSRYILQGIVSFGPKPCGTGRPGIYTDVSKYVEWILDNIEP